MSNMLADDADTRELPARETKRLDRLIRQQGLKRYALFLVSGEGMRLPDASEDASGYVIDELGRVFFFWLGWDGECQGVTFSEWEQVGSEPDWARIGEYGRARRAVGLSG